ncbi:MAG: hypothetical protein SFW07_07585 [Gammaproteobacteria bacterium]|nr:hypothetical protein [Gammaproteobacteria bacterium]
MVTLKKSHPACSVKEGTWEDFRHDVKKVNPKLFEIIEKISPSNKYKLLEVTYVYGEKITDMGTICLPDKNGRTVRLDDPTLPEKYREQLGYCPTPLILQLTKTAEVFVDTGERIVPLNIFTPGDLYGLFEAIMPLTNCPIAPCWSVTAGARSVFMGATVSNSIGQRKLRETYGVRQEPPKKLMDEWHTIKMIGNHNNEDSPWTCKLLLFTKDWLEEREDDLGWLGFHYYLLKQSWNQSKYMRSKSELSIMWEAFASAIRTRNLKPGPYILGTIMHNIFLANGAIPGFIPVDTSQLLLPSRSVEEAYQNIYGLKEYAPIIMAPWRLGAQEKHHTVYYSLAYPTMLESTPAIRHALSIISELRDTKMLMQTLETVLKQHGDLTYQYIKKTHFEYFHTEEDQFKEIGDSKDITNGDSNLVECTARFDGKIFPYKGPFFMGVH